MARIAYRCFGFLALGLAIAGVVLPGLPATPFALLAVWAFGRGSPERAARVERHPRLGPLIVNWRERGVVPRSAKILAVASMISSFALLWISGADFRVLALVGAILCATALFLLTRPSR